MELREKLGEREKPSEIFAPLAFELFRLQGKKSEKKGEKSAVSLCKEGEDERES